MSKFQNSRFDLDAFKWILAFADLTGRLARWRFGLLKIEFYVDYCTGMKHEAADALLPLATSGRNESPLKDELSLLVFDQFVNENISYSTVHSNDHRVANIDIINGAMNNPTYKPLTLVKLIYLQQNVSFCRTASV